MPQRQKEILSKSISAISDRDSLIYAYVDAGYTLTPLSGKIPLVKDWVKTEYDPLLTPDEIDGNFGVVLKEDDIIIDVDPRNFPKGDNPLKRLVKDLGINLTSFTVKTGGGGLHIYMKKPADLKIRGSHPDYPGIEFKTKGQQVVGAGSKHPDSGKYYTVAKLTPADAKEAPEALLNLIERKSLAVQEIGIENFTDDEQSIDRCAKYLQSCPPAIEGERGDVTTFKTACRCRDFGLSPQKTFELMAIHWNPRCRPEWDLEELKRKIENAYRYNVDVIGKKHPSADFAHVTTTELEVEGEEEANIKWDINVKTGMLKPTLQNTVNYMLGTNSPCYDMIRLNEFTNDIEFVKAAPWHNGRAASTWTDSDAINYKYWLATEKHFDTSTVLCHEAALVVAGKKRFHPVREYLKSLKWDGKSRLGKWLSTYAGVKYDPYTRAVGKKVLVGAVARVFSPGIKFDYMLVLEGKQGIGKSTLVSILGGQWYGDVNITDSDKDTIDSMRGKWIIEVSEMVCSRKVETDKLKSFLSKSTDRVRLAYRRNAEDYPRQSIFIGTVNPEADSGYLRDTTGNRRFWPVFCEYIDLEALRQVRDQLWAEAVVSYFEGEPLYLEDEKVREIQEAITEERRQKDPWLEHIREWLERPDIELKALREAVTSKEILEECIGIAIHRVSGRELNRISHIMVKELGWEKGKVYHKKLRKTVNGYKRPVDLSG